MHSHYGKYIAFWEAKTCIGRKMRCIGQVLDEYWTCIGQELLPENRGVLVENKGVLDLSAHRLGDLATMLCWQNSEHQNKHFGASLITTTTVQWSS